MSVSIKNLEQYLEDVHSQQIKEFEILKKFTHALATGKEDTEAAGSNGEKSSSVISKKSWVEDQMHAPCTKDIVLLCKEQLRHDKLLGQLTGMLTDLIKVNLQREIPVEQQSSYMPQANTSYMFQIDRVASKDAQNFLSSKRDAEESLLVGDTTLIGEAEQAAASQIQEDKIDYIDIQSPVLSYNTRLEAKEEMMASITASPFDRVNSVEIGKNGSPSKELFHL